MEDGISAILMTVLVDSHPTPALHPNGSGCWEGIGLTIYLIMATPSAALNPDCYCASHKIKSSMQLPIYLHIYAGKMTF